MWRLILLLLCAILASTAVYAASFPLLEEPFEESLEDSLEDSLEESVEERYEVQVEKHVKEPVKKRRNVLIFFADDGGFQQSAYNNTDCDTPNLDNLAKRSVTFKYGYTSVSSCSPSRSVILTGIPQHQNGMYGLAHGAHHFQSFDYIQSLPNVLSKNGFYTGIIGKYHINPRNVYTFDYRHTNVNQDGRNITRMKQRMTKFFKNVKKEDKPFFLYMAIHDPHRKPGSRFGNFMNKWGDGQPGNGYIKDWKPVHYDPSKIKVPYFLPDTPATRQDIADMYTTFNRLDQGIGLFMKELEAAGYLDNTLVMWTSDNGIPFPNAKTNLYEPGMGEPMMISNPEHKEHWGKMTDAKASTMDFAPTIYNWLGVKYPHYEMNGKKVKLTGRNLLPVTENPDTKDFPYVFSSHDFHEVTMAYPMRVMRNDQFRLIHNINHGAPYPLATDLFGNPTFQDILNRTRHGQPTNWFKTLKQYYHRDEWELFDLHNDPKELKNLAYNPRYADVFKSMNETLFKWQQDTHDPWLCMPHGILHKGRCYDMDNQ